MQVQIYTVIASSATVVLTAGYILWMLQQAFYGPVKEQYNNVKDADGLEKFYMFVLVAVIMWSDLPAVLTDVLSLASSRWYGSSAADNEKEHQVNLRLFIRNDTGGRRAIAIICWTCSSGRTAVLRWTALSRSWPPPG